MTATIRQRLKANEKKEPEINLKHIDKGPDTDEQGNVNPIVVKFSDRSHEIFTTSETSNDVGNFTEAMKIAATETLNIKPSKGKRQDCDPEMATLMDKRLQAISQYIEEETKQVTKSVKKMAAQKRTKAQLN